MERAFTSPIDQFYSELDQTLSFLLSGKESSERRMDKLYLSLLLFTVGSALPTDFVKTISSGEYERAAVATDTGVCSDIGAKILKRGGSAVDSAIASLLCVGVVNLHSTGIGGGGFMIFYEASTKKSYSLDYRETAPGAATYDMYDGQDRTASTKGMCSCNDITLALI